MLSIEGFSSLESNENDEKVWLNQIGHQSVELPGRMESSHDRITAYFVYLRSLFATVRDLETDCACVRLGLYACRTVLKCD